MDMLYNGVWLTMNTLSQFDWEAVYDDSQTDWLFDRYTIVGTAVVNGQAEVRSLGGPPVSYRRTDVVNGANVSWTATSSPPAVADRYARPSVNLDAHPTGVSTVAGAIPRRGIYARRNNDLDLFDLVAEAHPVPRTFNAIRTRLMMPRAPLWVFSGTGTGDEVLLRSPLEPEHQCDAFNGPKPMFCRSIYSAGEADTHVIEFGIQTFVRDSASTVKTRSGNPLLNNRFQMKHSVTEEGINYIQVQGQAHFRTDLEYATPLSPDDIRNRLLLPVPRGYVRQNIDVEGLPGANGVKYAFIDRKMAVNFPAGPFAKAAKIEAIHNQMIFTDTDLIKVTGQLVDDMVKSILNNKLLAAQIKVGTASLPGPVTGAK